MIHRCLKSYVFATTVAIVTACGGGGSGGGDSGASAPAAQTGTVSISLSDGPIDDYDQVLMEIAEIRLLGDSGQDIVVLDDPVTVDFLALQNFSEMLVRREVIAGTYSKIRLILNSLTLVKLDDAGNIESEDDVRLNGLQKIDINPRGPFTVRGGEEILINIDIDLDKSIHVVSSGNSGQIRFRPVIFAAIETEPAFDNLYRVEGTIDSIDAANDTFEVCDIRRAFDDRQNRPNPVDVCVHVDPSTITNYFGEDANPDTGGFDALAVNDHVVVYGKFDGGALEDTLVPVVIASGLDFDRPKGVAASEYRTSTNDFDLGVATPDCTIDPDPLRVVLATGALAFIETTDGAERADLTSVPLLCRRTEVEGRLDTSVPADTFLRTFIVLLGEVAAGRLELIGTLADKTTTVATDDFDLDLSDSTTNEVVVVGPDTRIVKITADSTGNVVEELTTVPTDVEVTVFGVRRTDGSAVVDASFILQQL